MQGTIAKDRYYSTREGVLLAALIIVGIGPDLTENFGFALVGTAAMFLYAFELVLFMAFAVVIWANDLSQGKNYRVQVRLYRWGVLFFSALVTAADGTLGLIYPARLGYNLMESRWAVLLDFLGM